MTQHDDLDLDGVDIEELPSIDVPKQVHTPKLLLAFFQKLAEKKMRMSYGMFMDCLKVEGLIKRTAPDIQVTNEINARLSEDLHHFVCNRFGSWEPRIMVFFKEGWEQEVDTSRAPLADASVYVRFKAQVQQVIAARR
jgi:hypothetical protein